MANLTTRPISGAKNTNMVSAVARPVCLCDDIQSVLPKTVSFTGTANVGELGADLSKIVIPDACGFMEDFGLLLNSVIPQIKGGASISSWQNLMKTYRADVAFITLESQTDDGFSTTMINTVKIGPQNAPKSQVFDPAGSVRNTQEQLSIQTIRFEEQELILDTLTGLFMDVSGLAQDLKFTITVQVREWLPY